jgi:hypothetical protein
MTRRISDPKAPVLEEVKSFFEWTKGLPGTIKLYRRLCGVSVHVEIPTVPFGAAFRNAVDKMARRTEVFCPGTKERCRLRKLLTNRTAVIPVCMTKEDEQVRKPNGLFRSETAMIDVGT